MSKGRKSKVLQGATNQTIMRPRESFKTVGYGHSKRSADEFCWHFTLVGVEASATSAGKDTKVTGSIQGVRVSVSASVGFLGFAPSIQAQRIIHAAKRGGQLEGSVTTMAMGSVGPSVILCLRDT